MTFQELDILLDQYIKDKQSTLENTRLNCYYNSPVIDREIVKAPSDIFSLYGEENEIIELTEEEILISQFTLLDIIKQL